MKPDIPFSRLLVIATLMLSGCDQVRQSVEKTMQDVAKQSADSARRELRTNQFKVLGRAYHGYMDASQGQGPPNWEALEAYLQTAPPDMQAPVRQLHADGVIVHWGMRFVDIRQGTSNYLLAYDPRDLQSEGGVVLIGDGSVRWMRRRVTETMLAYQRGELQQLPDLTILEWQAEEEAKQAAQPTTVSTPSTPPSSTTVATTPPPPPLPPPPPPPPAQDLPPVETAVDPNASTADPPPGGDPAVSMDPTPPSVPLFDGPGPAMGPMRGRPMGPPGMFGPEVAATGRETELVGGSGGLPFREVDSRGRRITGLRCAAGSWAGQNGLARLIPIYEGERYSPGPMVAVARDGYALGGLEVDAAQFVNAVRPVYMRMAADGRLDPSDTYTGEWLGAPSGRPSRIVTGNGSPVVGLFGRGAAMVDAMGLVLGE